MNDWSVEVEEGEVLVNTVSVLISEPRFVLLEVDCRSKHSVPAVVFGFRCGAQDPPEIALRADEATLLTALEGGITTIRLPEFCRGWDAMAETAKHTVRIAAWERPGRGREVWRTPRLKAGA